MTKVNNITVSFDKLKNWIQNNGWAGYDPYDIKSKRWFVRLQVWGNKSRTGEIIREVVTEFFLMFPNLFRRITRVNKQINAKAMGLIASAYLDFYKHSNQETYLESASKALNWLEENKTIINDGYGWGYPFDWQSKRFIPANTPNGIVTTAVGEAFWKKYTITQDPRDLYICTRIATFLFSLPKVLYEGNLCFSYTPLFINHVHNLNLFVAEYLIKIGKEINHSEWIETGLKAADYTISDQNRDGSFNYTGPPDNYSKMIDNYHTCFVMRMLHSIYYLTGKKKYFTSLKNCHTHYMANFFQDEAIPKFTPERLYRIDIHSSAEAIHCLSILEKDFPGSLQQAIKIAQWTIENLQDKSGYFYHGIFKSRITGIPFKSKIPYIRWGQAWMLRAFASLIPRL